MDEPVGKSSPKPKTNLKWFLNTISSSVDTGEELQSDASRGLGDEAFHKGRHNAR